MTIDKFSGEYEFLSNFYFSPIVVRMEYAPNKYTKMAFSTLEHAFHAKKMRDFRHVELIQSQPTPKEAKLLGKRLPRVNNWHDIRVPEMTKLVDIKFPLDYEVYTNIEFISQLTQQLLSTEDEELIEGNYWDDRFWGVCNGRGENNLGKILVARRTKVAQILAKHRKC
jgi:hypothetical protein